MFIWRRATARRGGGLIRRLVAASTLLALVVAGGFAVMLVGIDELRDDNRRTRRSQDLAVAANQLERLLLDLETGQRGYVLTRRSQFLEPWTAARARFPARARTLLTIAAGDPDAAARAADIVRAERAYIDEYSVPLVAAARRGEPSASSIAEAIAGKRRVDALRLQFDELLGRLQRTAEASSVSAESATRRAALGAALGLGGSVVLIALFVAYLSRAIVHPVRRAAAMAGRLAGGDLSTRLPQTEAGEIGELQRAFNVMGRSLEHNRDELAALAEEQAALRRVATLVARGASPPEVFSAVAEELARLLGLSITNVLRYEPDGTATVVGGWSERGGHIAVGMRVTMAGQGVAVSVLRTGRPARTDHFEGPPGSAAEFLRRAGARTGAGAPVVVEGRLWGVAVAASTQSDSLPPAAEDRIAAFTELAATAIANAQARVELRGIADEQAALRRVATLVARGAAPDAVFAAVSEEVGRLLGADVTTLARFDEPTTVTPVSRWSRSGEPAPSAGDSLPLGGRDVSTLVFETGRPARVESHGPQPATVIQSGVGAPISVEGRLWGVMAVDSTGDPLPPGTEERLAGFTDLVATAIANADSQEELRASRARIVATADETRRRIERDLHDGAQQRLVSLALQLRATQAGVPPELGALRSELDSLAEGLTDTLDELREFARGIHPAILAEGGLGPALRTLARRSAVPVHIDVRADARLPEPLEVAAYYVVSEALTNAAKHARASVVAVEVEAGEGGLTVSVRDDGVGGAEPGRGSGLVGLKDRVEALGGRISIESPPGGGTSVRAELPLGDAGAA